MTVLRNYVGTLVLIATLLTVAACASSGQPKPSAAPSEASQAAKSAAPSASKPAASPSAGAAQAAAEWDKTLAAAKKEGKVAVIGPPGDTYRAVIDGFQAAYPEIKVSFIGGKSTDIAPRITAERGASQYLWDVFIGGGPQARDLYLKPGYFDPLPPALMMSEVLDDSKWDGGLAAGYLDTSKQYIYRFGTDLAPVAYVNRKLAPKTELNTIDGLLDAKWKGKIIMRPGTAGLVRNSLGVQLLVRGKDGEDWLRKFLSQDIKISNDERMVAEGIIRGGSAIAIGITPTTVDDYARQGLAGDLEALQADSPLGASISGGQTFLSVFKNAPNPNAEKVFVNWLLSKAGQQLWEDKTGTPVRRLDTAKTSKAARVKPGDKFVLMDTEDVQPYMDKASQLIKEMIK